MKTYTAKFQVTLELEVKAEIADESRAYETLTNLARYAMQEAKVDVGNSIMAGVFPQAPSVEGRYEMTTRVDRCGIQSYPLLNLSSDEIGFWKKS